MQAAIPSPALLSVIGSSAFFFVLNGPVPTPGPVSQATTSTIRGPSYVTYPVSKVPKPSSYGEELVLSASVSTEAIPHRTYTAALASTSWETAAAHLVVHKSASDYFGAFFV